MQNPFADLIPGGGGGLASLPGQPLPAVIRGPAREPPPQTVAQEEKDRLEAERLRREAARPVMTKGQDAVDAEFAKDYAA